MAPLADSMQPPRSDVAFEQAPGVVARQIGDETILVPVRENVGDLDHVYSLSEVATFIWGSLNGRDNVDRIVELVVQEFEVDAVSARSDVMEFLGDLAGAGLIRERQDR